MKMITVLSLPCTHHFSSRVTLSLCKDAVKLLKVVETTEINIALIEPRQNLTTADSIITEFFRHYNIFLAIIASCRLHCARLLRDTNRMKENTMKGVIVTVHHLARIHRRDI